MPDGRHEKPGPTISAGRWTGLLVVALAIALTVLCGVGQSLYGWFTR